VLRREAVVHGEHVGPGVAAQEPAVGVVGIKVAEHEPAAVEKHDEGARTVGSAGE
jgi:hypothetical protein